MSGAPAAARDADGLPVSRVHADGGWWEVTTDAPDARLRGLVRDYQGYVARTPGVLRQRQLPSGDVTLVINLRAPLRVFGPGDATRATAHESFVAGLHDAWAETETDGELRGVEVRLTPLGAYRLLGGGTSVCLCVVVDDPDAHHARAAAAGAEILRAPFDTGYGSRDYTAQDPEGHVWHFGTYVPGTADG